MDYPVFGVVVPHPPIFVPAVGGSRAIDGASLSLAALQRAGDALRRFDPETLIVMSPHAPAIADAFAVDGSAVFEGSLAEFGDSTVYRFEGDPEFAATLIRALHGAGIATVSRDASDRLRPGWLDHATIVPLAMLGVAPTTRLVVISLSGLPYCTHRYVGSIVRSVAEALGRVTAFIASGDLSHRLTPDAPAGYSPRAAELDAQIVRAVEHGRLVDLMSIDHRLIDIGGECGLRSVIAVGGYCCDDPAPTRVLAYEGPWGVGYLTALVGHTAVELDDANRDQSGAKGGMPGRDGSEIVALARRVIESALGADTEAHAHVLADPGLPERAGVFVSLHRHGMLRGCIGTIMPVQETLAGEVEHNAIEAAFHDPRFPALEPHELEELEIKVDVLHSPESCTMDDLDPAVYGVIVSSGWRRGLLLPDLEGVDDVQSQVRIAMNKAGISPNESCDVERFRVDRYT